LNPVGAGEKVEPPGKTLVFDKARTGKGWSAQAQGRAGHGQDLSLKLVIEGRF